MNSSLSRKLERNEEEGRGRDEKIWRPTFTIL